MIDSLFGSRTRVKLLYLFMNNPKKAFYVREITRKIDEQINSVRRELSNMLDIGIIFSDTKENKLYYEVNTKSKFYKPLQEMFSSKNTADSVTNNDVQSWSKRFTGIGDVRVLILAGKLVNAFDDEIDLLVVGDINGTKLKNLIATIEQEEGLTLSYTSLDYEDFYYRLSVHDEFVENILNARHAVVIDTENILKNK